MNRTLKQRFENINVHQEDDLTEMYLDALLQEKHH